MGIQHLILPNGLTIIGEPKPSAHSMAGGFFVKTGSRDEWNEVAGVSHFLEHMMFKGTDRRSGEDVNREFDEIGAQYNAFTSEENTVYYGAVLPEFQGRLLDILSDMMRPALRGDDFDLEKNVILEEIALYQDRPQHVAFDLLREVFFRRHPLGNSVLGSTQSVGGLQRDQMQDYFNRRYVPDNMTFTIVGSYDWDAALDLIQQRCAHWEPAAATRSHPPVASSPSTHVVTNPKLARAHVAFASPGVSAQDARHRAADVLSDVIGGSRGSRLYWALVEPGLADVAQVFHDEGDQGGWFGAYISCDPTRAEEVRARCVDILQEACASGIREEEVARVTRKGASAHVIRGETPMGRLTSVGFDWMYRGEVESVDEEADAYLRITAEDCNSLLKEFPFDKLTTVVLGPIQPTLSPVAPAPGVSVDSQDAQAQDEFEG
jgi:predicted Zn-dependent peptidase